MSRKTPQTKASMAQFWRPYQKRYICDQGRLQLYCKSRQIGISEASSFKGAREAATNRRRDVYFVSTNFANAKDLIRKAKWWLQVMAKIRPNLAPSLALVTENVSMLELANGSRLIALPCKPGSVRGKSGTIILDEAAHYENDMEMYAAIAPAIVSQPDLRLILVSTPFGPNGLFYKAWTGELGDETDEMHRAGLAWSRHETDVFGAVADGFPEEVLLLEDQYPSDIWAQEFLCQFISDSTLYFKHALLKKAMADVSEPDTRDAKRVLGIDLASETDKSVWVDMVKVGDSYHVLDTGDMSADDRDKPLTYPEQYDVLTKKIANTDYYQVAVDATGEGKGLSQWLQRDFGSDRVVGVHFTNQWKAKYIPQLKLDMDRSRFHMPNHPKLRADFQKIKRKVTTANNEIFAASRDADGHADGFFAALLGYSMLYRPPKPKNKRAKAHKPSNASLAKKYMGY